MSNLYLDFDTMKNTLKNYEDLEKSLRAMASECWLLKVKILAMPRIACGLDKLNWKTVKNMLEYVFKELDITIYVYVL